MAAGTTAVICAAVAAISLIAGLTALNVVRRELRRAGSLAVPRIEEGRSVMQSLFTALVGREDSPATEWNSMAESSRWIGKPWRRIELLTQRHFWKGEQTEANRTLTLHLGRKRGGFNVTLILSRDHYDYSEERP